MNQLSFFLLLLKLLTDRLGFFLWALHQFSVDPNGPSQFIPQRQNIKKNKNKNKLKIPVLRQPPVEMFLLTFDNTVNKVMKSAKQSSPARQPVHRIQLTVSSTIYPHARHLLLKSFHSHAQHRGRFSILLLACLPAFLSLPLLCFLPQYSCFSSQAYYYSKQAVHKHTTFTHTNTTG